PNAVVDWIWAPTFSGMNLTWPESSSSFSRTGPGPPASTPATRPTCTPRSLTLAPDSITRPARSEVNVTGTVLSKDLLNDAEHTVAKVRQATMRMTVHHAGRSRRCPGLWSTVLPGQIEVAGLAVDGQGHEQHDDCRADKRGAHRPADRLTDSGGSARGGVAVVGVHQHDPHGHR